GAAMVVLPVPTVVCERDRSCRHECDNRRRQKHFPEQSQCDPLRGLGLGPLFPEAAPPKASDQDVSALVTAKDWIRFFAEPPVAFAASSPVVDSLNRGGLISPGTQRRVVPCGCSWHPGGRANPSSLVLHGFR